MIAHFQDPADLRELLTTLLRFVRKIRRAASRMEELCDETELYLDERVKDLDRSSHGGPVSPPPDDPPPPGLSLTGEEKERLLAEAEKGFSRMEFNRLGNGDALVSIEGSSVFVVPPKLADLLEILRTGVPDPEDRLLPWKSYKEVVGELERMRPSRKRTGRKALRQLIHRLRRTFRRHGVNRYFIGTREGAVRLAWRPADESVTGSDRL